MEDYIQRIITLVEILAAPNKELILDIYLDNLYINSIELISDDFVCHIWREEFEFNVYSDELTDDQLLILVDGLEKILMN